MNFSQALELLKNDKLVYREGWNGSGMTLCLQIPDEYSKMTLPYIFIRTAQGDLVPWVASQTDILSDDWMEFVEAKTVVAPEGGEDQCQNQDK